MRKRMILPALNYHGIEQEKGEYFWKGGELTYVVEKDVFKRQIAHLRDAGYESLNSKEIGPWLAGEPRHRKPIVLTFDDGHRSHFEHAAPILTESGMKGIFFVSAGRVGKEDFMSWQQLKELVRAGFEIGAHGYDHIPLPGLLDEELRREIVTAKKTLEDGLGTGIISYSIPRGFYHKTILPYIDEAGYEYLFTSHFGLNRPSQDPRYLKRMAVTAETEFRMFSSWVAGDIGFRKVGEDMKEQARRFLGPSFYIRLAELKAACRSMLKGGRK